MAPPPSHALVDFVLQQMRVTTNVCSLQRHERGYRLQHRTVPDYNLLYVTRGRVEWIIDGAATPLGPQDLLIVRPGEPHPARSRTRRVTLTSIHVEPTLPGGGDAFDLLRPPRVRSVRRGGRLDRYWRGAMEEFDGEQPGRRRTMLHSWARLITLELLRCDQEAGTLAYVADDPLVAEALEHLSGRLATPPTLAELAAWAGYSPQHLNRTFRRVLGVTPLQYLMRMRMERAAELLIEGRLTVRAVGERVGFADPYYFSRAFKQHFGRSPRDYQQAADSHSPSPPSPAPFGSD
jgi:AraC-like DNA-binding protein/mannose-6-phosphate isomerase-like protein (cupin superfamily)